MFTTGHRRRSWQSEGGSPPPSNGVLRSPYIHLLIIIVYYLICVASVTLNKHDSIQNLTSKLSNLVDSV